MQFHIQTLFVLLSASLAIARPKDGSITIDLKVDDVINGLTRRDYNSGYGIDYYGHGGRRHGYRHGSYKDRSGYHHRDYDNYKGSRHGIYRRDRGHANYGSRRHISF